MNSGFVAFLFCCVLLCFSGCKNKAPDSAGRETGPASKPADEFEEQRRSMVETQIRARGVRDTAVLAAMIKVPRHLFVPEDQRVLSAADHPLPIGYGQTISQPFIVAYMTQAVEASPHEKVLEIGTGSGYQAAVLGELVKEVYTVEIIPELADRARQTLSTLGYRNVHVKTGNGYEGWGEHAPFDGIVVTAAPDHVPQALVDQLAINGNMVIPVGVGDQEMLIITRTRDGVVEKRTIPVRFVPMTGQVLR